MSGSGAMANALSEAGAVSWGAVLQGGQPITLACPTETAAERLLRQCFPARISRRGMHIDAQGQPSFLGNPAAFTQPCVFRSTGPDPTSVPGCIPINGGIGRWVVPRPSPRTAFHRLDFSTFKDFEMNERFRCSSELSSSTSSTTRTSTLRASAVTALSRSRCDATTPARTLAKWVRLAMLPTIRGRSSWL